MLIFRDAIYSELCRELRRRETEAEKILWLYLRNRNLFRHKFLRQYPVWVTTAFGKKLYYIPDFYCHQSTLVVEADGPGLTIIRFYNDQIINNIELVVETIKQNL